MQYPLQKPGPSQTPWPDSLAPSQGGLYIAGKREVRDEHCLEIECCSVEFDGCDTELWVQHLDPSATPLFPGQTTTIEAYPRLDVGLQLSYWDPAPVFSRSIDDEPDGNAVYFWRKPLVHEGSTYPDAFGYNLGYVICAQKATPDSLATWGDGGCIPVAQILSEYDDDMPYSWYRAVDDGEGGAFVVFHDRNSEERTDYIRAQHISSSGQVLWNDLDGP